MIIEPNEILDPSTATTTEKQILESALKTELSEAYREALQAIDTDGTPEDPENIGESDAVSKSFLSETSASKIRELAKIKHAARGTFLTLALYKTQVPAQDIRMCKSEHPNGFSARAIDTSVTVPFLLKETLPRNVETHWLTQSFSFAEPWTRDRMIKTVPRKAGTLLVEVVNDLEEIPSLEAQQAAHEAVVIVLTELIKERNRGRVPLTRPKNLTIDETCGLLSQQFRRSYKTGGPRLPQLAVYAAYSCLFESGVGRFNDWKLEALGRMKAADRKSGTVGDIVVTNSGRPIEAVETKMGVSIDLVIVLEAMQKIVSVSVERYLILSTVGMVEGDRAEIASRCRAFKKSNGCEVIVNGVLDTIGYYLRLLPSTAMYLDTYAELMEGDIDLDYEHRVVWNEICAAENLV